MLIVASLASFNFAGVVLSATVFGRLPGSLIVAVDVVFVSGNLPFGTVKLPSSPTVNSSVIPGILTFVPVSYLPPPVFVTVTVTFPVVGSCSMLIVASLASFNFAGITLLSSVSTRSFPSSFTATLPVCTSSFNCSFLIVIVPSFTLNVPSIPGTVTTESSG